MAFRKRRRPTPEFGIPPPLSPITGDQATLREYGLHPYCAMMQVAEEDKYTDYVMCRGFDPRIGKFIDYADGDSDNPGIAVAKPFGNRVKCYYQIGQVYPAFLPTQGPGAEGRLDTDTYVPPSPTDVDWRLGQNPGTAPDACIGQPQSLADTIEALLDHNDKYVNWMLIDSGPVFLWVRLTENLVVCRDADAEILIIDDAGDWEDSCTYTDITVSDPYGVVLGSALAQGSGVGAYIPENYNVLVMRVMDPKPDADGTPRVCQWVAVAFGKCPADDCTLFEDNFDRGDSTDIGDDWTEVAEDWDILSNQLHIDAADAQVLCDYEYPDSPIQYIAHVTMTGDDQGDQLYIAIDDDTYRIEVEWGYANGSGYEGRVRIYKDDGAYYVLRGSRPVYYLPPGTPITLDVYVADGFITVVTDLDQDPWGAALLSIEADPINSAKIHLGTGDDLTSDAYFDDFEVEKHYNVDHDCPDKSPVCVYFRSHIDMKDGDFIDEDDWDVGGSTGTWDIESNRLAVSDSNAALMSICENPAESVQMRIDASMTADNAGDVLKVFFNEDGDESDRVEFEWGDGSFDSAAVRVYVGGVLQAPEVAMDVDPGASITAWICVSAITINVLVVEQGVNITRPVSSASQVFGIGTGSIGGEVSFAVTAQRTRALLANCPSCYVECEYCTDDLASNDLLVTIPTLPTDDCDNETDCPALAGAYLVGHHAACAWEYIEWINEWCGISGSGIKFQIRILVTIVPDYGTCILSVTIFVIQFDNDVFGDVHTGHRWEETGMLCDIDCITMDKTLSYDSGGGHCVGIGTTAHLESQ